MKGIPNIRPAKNAKRNLLALGIAIVAGFYLAAIFADFLAPYDYRYQERSRPSAPASVPRFRDAEGRWSFRPFVYRSRMVDPVARRYESDTSHEAQIAFFSRGHSYNLLGLVATDIHLFGVANHAENAPGIYLAGTDGHGRDRFSRLLQATRFSLIVSPIGVVLASFLGVLVGLVSGYAGRLTDTVLMGISDAVISLPTLILILAARAAFPLELPPMRAALLLILIFAATGWAEMARLTRGLVLATREREFVLAAKASGLTEARILFRHILPNVSRPLIIQAVLMLPVFLLAEVALSFLGVGLQEPEPSLGNMLAAALDLPQLREQPLLMLLPAIVIFVFVLGVHLLVAGLKPSKRQGL